MTGRLLAILLLAAGWMPAQPSCIPASTQDYFRKNSTPSGARRWLAAGDALGKLVVVAVDDAVWSGLYAFRANTGELLWHKPLLGQPAQIAVSPDGQWLAIAATTTFCKAPKIQLWSAATGEQRPKLTGWVDQQGYSVAFSPDSKLLAGSTNGKVSVWEAASGKVRAEIEPPGFETHEGIERIGHLAFGTKAQELTGISTTGYRYVWNLESGKQVSRVKKPAAESGETSNAGIQANQVWHGEGGDWKATAPTGVPANAPLTVELVNPSGGPAKKLVIPPRSQ